MADEQTPEQIARDLAGGWWRAGVLSHVFSARQEAELAVAIRRAIAGELKACIETAEGEHLLDETGEKSDEAYNMAIDHVVAALRARGEAEKGGEG